MQKDNSCIYATIILLPKLRLETSISTGQGSEQTYGDIGIFNQPAE